MEHTAAKAIFFHVGMPKTASTFLQRNVFPKFKGIRFIKKHDFKHHGQIIREAKEDRIMLSIELNLDAPGGFNKMRTIAEKYPGTKPVIVLRRQGSWLQSKYKYYLRKHGTASFSEYFHPEGKHSVLSAENLQYFPKIRMLEEHYGTRPLVFFQEELKKAPMEFIDQLAQFTGASYQPQDIKISNVKSSYSPKQLLLVRQFNRWYGFNDQHTRNKARKFAYKKISAMMLHAVAFTGNFIKAGEKEELIPQHVIDDVNIAFASDWQQCLDYARQDRKLLI